MEAGGKVYVFSGDTGPSEHLKALAKGPNYLICEVIDLARVERLVRAFPGFTPDQLPSLMQHLVADHLTGDQNGEIAAEAEVKKHILPHFWSGSDGQTNLHSYAAAILSTLRGDVN